MFGEKTMSCRKGAVFASAALLVLGLLPGCGGTHTLTGTVTFEGRPVERGYITFFPAEGTGNTCGAEIVDGQFCLNDFAPGKKRALVTVHPQVEMRGHGQGKKAAILPHRPIASDAIGNNRIVEIAASTFTLDIELWKTTYPTAGRAAAGVIQHSNGIREKP